MIPAPSYRLPAETKVGRVRLAVADLGRSTAYYENVLGMRVLEASAEQAVLGAVGGSSEGARGSDASDRGAGAETAPLVELQEVPGAAPVPRRGRLGLFHFAILLPDRASLGRFLGHLGEHGVRPGASDHFVSEALYLQDPDGLGIEVYADRPRSEWRRREDGEIVMTTEPLDVASLREAAADAGETAAPWDGMPRRTTMGHVHLHVGDLDRASAFYHEALGLDETVWSYPGALFLSAGGYHHHLGLNTWARGAAPAGAGDARLLEWELVVPSRDDVAGAAESLAAAGHTVDRVAGEAAVVRDPWGTTLRIRVRAA